ncbi:MAG: DUF2254 domain-containing protein [Gammaproteobacteria bacterium]|nr:DUF2254 domain-containing protein [Gammaproteobacteria bacterium]
MQFLIRRISERLWVRPLLMCAVSVCGALVASATDRLGIAAFVPEISRTSIETLLNNLAASMLVIATFAVGSMVASYASASRNATPRSLPLVLADDVSQNALATFIGAFIFSTVAIVAVQNGYYEKTGRFTLFVFTVITFTAVILTFVRWVDRIARLGLLSMTIESVEKATAKALENRGRAPRLGGIAVDPDLPVAWRVYADAAGYVQRVNIDDLQDIAAAAKATITVEALPGTFAMPGRALASVSQVEGDPAELDSAEIAAAFIVGRNRTFDEDPRFGLIALSEIGGRALSPAVNDPGTAISVIGVYMRLFMQWDKAAGAPANDNAEYDRVAVPTITLDDMFEDAFAVIARDGAGSAEVVIRLLKALEALTRLDGADMQAAAERQALSALECARNRLQTAAEIQRVESVAGFVAES